MEVNSTERKTNNPHQCKCGNVSFCSYKTKPRKAEIFLYPFPYLCMTILFTCYEFQHVMVALRMVYIQSLAVLYLYFSSSYFLSDDVYCLQIVTYVECMLESSPLKVIFIPWGQFWQNLWIVKHEKRLWIIS